ncbi:MAG: hypothetical protein ACP5P1_01215 [Acidimicrobiales bacterium]
MTAELTQLVSEVTDGAAGLSARAVLGPGRRWWLAPFESSGQVLIGIVVAESGNDEAVATSSPTPKPAGGPGGPAGASGGALSDPYIVKGMEAVIEVMTTLASNLDNR